MIIFFPLMAVNLFAFYPDFLCMCVSISPRNLPPLLWCKADAFVKMHLSGKAPSRLPSGGCASYHWHKGWGDLLQFFWWKRNRPCLPLLYLQALLVFKATLIPLPCQHIAQQWLLKSFQSRNNFYCIFTNLRAVVSIWKESQWRMRNWQGAKGKIVLSSSEQFLPNGIRKQATAAFSLCSPQDLLTLAIGKKSAALSEPTMSSKALSDPAPLSAFWAGAGAFFSLPTLIWGNPDYLCACY